jgi:hypothetical protein
MQVDPNVVDTYKKCKLYNNIISIDSKRRQLFCGK